MSYWIIIILPLALIFLASDYHNRHKTASKLRWLGDFLFRNYIRSLILWELLLFSVFLDGYFELFAPDILYSHVALIYWFLCIFVLIGVAVWNHLRFHPIEVKEVSLGSYLVEVAEEKSASSSDLNVFFTKLILEFENQPHKKGYDEYEASKEIFMKREDEIGSKFREILSEL